MVEPFLQYIAVQAAKDKDHLPIRATGGAIGRNHICIIIPCHRVVGVNHNLTGYGGGIDKKIQLFKLEGVDINQFKEPQIQEKPANRKLFYLFVFFRKQSFGIILLQKVL